MPAFLEQELKEDFKTLLNPNEFEAEELKDNFELQEFEKIEREELHINL